MTPPVLEAVTVSTRRRALAWLVAAVVLGSASALVARPSGAAALAGAAAVTALGATTLSRFVPARGWRPDLGCTPCGVASALTVPLAVALLAAPPTDLPPALAPAVAALGLVQRLREASTCERR